MSAQSLRAKTARLFELTGFRKTAAMMVNGQLEHLSKFIPPVVLPKLTEELNKRFGDSFMQRVICILIESGLDEESVDAALEFYSGPGAKFMALCQSPEFVGGLQQVAEAEGRAAAKIAMQALGMNEEGE